MSSSNRGLGLIETLIAVGLAGMLFGLIAMLLAPVLATLHKTSARVEMEEEAAIALHRLDTDVRRTSPLSFCTAPTKPGIVLGMTRILDVTPGVLQASWEQQIVVWVWDSGAARLSRSVVDCSGPPLSLKGTAPANLTPALLASLANASDLTHNLTATGVSWMSVSPTAGGQAWTVSLTLHRDPGLDFTVTRTVGGRN